MKAKLQFTHYKVLEIIYKSAVSEETEEILQPEFSVDIILHEENPKKAMIKLGVELGGQSGDYVVATIAGFFTISSEEYLSEAEIVNFYRLNGVAILFPYLRSLVSDVTSKSDASPIILPTINIHKLMEEGRN